jgi:hypothetical protein
LHQFASKDLEAANEEATHAMAGVLALLPVRGAPGPLSQQSVKAFASSLTSSTQAGSKGVEKNTPVQQQQRAPSPSYPVDSHPPCGSNRIERATAMVPRRRASPDRYVPVPGQSATL